MCLSFHHLSVLSDSLSVCCTQTQENLCVLQCIGVFLVAMMVEHKNVQSF